MKRKLQLTIMLAMLMSMPAIGQTDAADIALAQTAVGIDSTGNTPVTDDTLAPFTFASYPSTPGSNDLLVYPNPAMSATRIVLDVTPARSVFVDVIDMNGNIDRSFEFAPGSYYLDIDLGDLPTGMYSLRVKGYDVGYHNLKVIKVD